MLFLLSGDSRLSGDVHPHGTETVQRNVTHPRRSDHSSDGVGARPNVEVFWSVASKLMFYLPVFSAVRLLVGLALEMASSM